MPRRLFDDDEPAPDELRLEGAERLELRAEAGLCGLAAGLRAALRYTGQELSYGLLMGLLGAAFQLHVEADFRAELTVLGRWRRAESVLRDLGHEAQLLEAPEPEALRELVSAELAARRPVLVLGWPAHPSDWALIAGQRGEQLLGLWRDSGVWLHPGPALAEWALILGPPREAASRRDAVEEALWPAVEMLRESETAWARWHDLLAEAEPYGPELGRPERMAGEQWLVACLGDARQAAADFLRETAGLFAESIEELLGEAAGTAERVAEVVEQLTYPVAAPQAAHWVTDPDWLARRRRTIADAAELDEALQEPLELADEM